MAEQKDWETTVQLEAEEYADTHIEEEKLKNKFISDKAIRMRLIAEYREACSMRELKKHIAKAVTIIQRDGQQELDAESWEMLEEEMVEASRRVASIEFDPETMTFQDYLGMTDRAFGCIEAIATKKYEKKKLVDCVSLYAFLSAMKGVSSLYWCRLGIALQESKEFEKAICAFGSALEFDSSNIAACLFSAECYLEVGKSGDARKMIEEATRLIEGQRLEEKWGELHSELQKQIG